MEGCGSLSMTRRNGTAMPYLMVCLTALMAFVSLAVDVGRVQVAKGELQLAADAAARHAVTGLPNGYRSALDRAVAAAGDNRADGAPVTLVGNEDVDFGTWDPDARVFAPLNGANRDDATAVRVTARRNAGRGTGVPLLFARVIGRSTCDASAVSVATIAPKQYGVVGLDYLNLGGNSTNSFWSASGSTTPGNWGSVASNGDITLNGSSRIRGDARPGPGHTVIGGLGKVTGVSTPLPAPLNYPPESPSPYGPAYNDNANLPGAVKSGVDFVGGGNYTLTGGHYFFRNFRVSGSDSVSFTNPTVVYAYGDVSVTGSLGAASGLAKNLRIVTVRDPVTGAAPGTISIGSNGALYADIYAPLSPLTVSGSGDIYGSIVAKSVDMGGSSVIHYDLSLRNSDGGVRLVK